MKRILQALVILLLILGLLAALGLHLATKTLKSKVEQALGPDSEVGAIQPV